jgi:uncharacterized protein
VTGSSPTGANADPGGDRRWGAGTIDTERPFPVVLASMLRLDLVELDRRGTATLDTTVPVDDPTWESSDLRLLEPVAVHLQASVGTAGQILLRGRVRTVVAAECRRCVKPLALPVDLELLSVMVPTGGDLAGSADDEPMDEALRPYDPQAGELDLADLVREELVLSAPAWPVCRPDCRGLCPRCGADLNESVCTCVRDESDPRWAALRALRPEE